MTNETDTAETARDQMLDGSSLTEQETELLDFMETHGNWGVEYQVRFTDARTREIGRNLLLHLWTYVGTDLHDTWVTMMYTAMLRALQANSLATLGVSCLTLTESAMIQPSTGRDVGQLAPSPYKENMDPVYTCGSCGAPGVNRRTCPGPGHYQTDSGEVSE